MMGLDRSSASCVMSFQLSWKPHSGVSATETRTLVTHKGSLYGGLGQWCNDGPRMGPQIIRLDSASGGWQLEATFPIDPVNRIAISCMTELHFPTANLTTLVCGFFGGSAVGVRNAAGQWSVTPIGNRRGQIRSFIAHKDSVTNVDMAFAGSDQGIFSGVYDTVLPGEIMWTQAPELDISNFPPMAGGHPERVMSMAELRGVLYATVGQRIYRRNDGGHSSWTKIFDNPLPGQSQSGLRGLTAINNNLWFGVEGTQCRIVSLDVTTGHSQTEVDISGPSNYYQIVAYNDILETQISGQTALLAGLDGSALSPAKYLTFHNGIWTKCDIPSLVSHPMRSVRTIVGSPFASSDVYFGGYDCNSDRSSNTAWVAAAPAGTVLSP
jgi:hypothetical protein